MSSKNSRRRRARNFLLQPFLQVRFGLYSVTLTFLLCAAIGLLMRFHLQKFLETLIVLTDVPEETRELLQGYLMDLGWSVGAVCVGFVAVNIIFSIFYTHRLVGPTYAFRRHIRSLAKGDYTARTKLRKGDAFEEVADELNALSIALTDKSGSAQPNRPEM